MAKSYSGYTCNTAQSMILDSGAFFKNFTIGVDTFDTALASGKCLGATQGGGTFVATPTIRAIPIDGIRTVGKGLERIDEWEISLQTNLIEITAETFRNALGNGFIDTTSNDTYDIIRAKSLIDSSDYFDNITWVGTLSGSNEPVIIQIYNAINLEGINMTMADKSEGIISTTFKAHQSCSDDINIQPFAIYYPKKIAKPTVEEIDTEATTLNGTGLVGATIYVSGGSIPTNTSTIVGINGEWTLTIPTQLANTIIAVVQATGNKYSASTTITVKLVAPTINPITEADTVATGTGLAGATVHLYGGNIPAGTTTVVENDNTWSINIPTLFEDDVIYAKQLLNGTESLTTFTIVTIE